MSKESASPILNIDLLKSQGSSQKLAYKAIKWLLSSGRYLIIFVEFIVLVAFVTRLFLDTQNESIKDDIAKNSLFAQSREPTETEIRKVQSQLISIKQAKTNSFNFDEALGKIAAQAPLGVSLINISFETSGDKIGLRLTGTAKSNLDLSTFVYGLKAEDSFTNIDITNVDLQQNQLNFSVNGDIKK